MKSTTKIIKIIFVAIFILQMAGLIVLLLAPQISQAADNIEFKPQITIPNSNFIAGATSTVLDTSIGEYIQAIYKYGIGIVGILATVVMMFGGFLYLTAAGDNSKISEAKEWIKASLTGLVIAMSSYMILATVNPALITLAPIKISKISEVGCCSYTDGGKTTTTETTKADCPTETNYKFTSGTCTTASLKQAGESCSQKSDCVSGLFCIAPIGSTNSSCGQGISEGETCGMLRECADGLKCENNWIYTNKCIKK